MVKQRWLTTGALGLALVTAGCAQPVPAAAFSGPWAKDFEYAYNTSHSGYVRAILEDEVITDQEYSETVARYRECMTAAGLTIESYEPGGGGSFSFPEEMGADAAYHASEQCSDSTGEKWVSSLYNFVRRNPDNVEIWPFLLQCLIDAGIVAPGYTREDFDRDSRRVPTFPFKDPEHDKPLFDECNADPLGLLR